MTALNRASDHPIDGRLSRLPSLQQCRELAEMLGGALAGRTAWEASAALATRLASVLPAAKADDMDKALAITEMAKAFAVYPATVAHWASDHLMATRRFRPVPADIHEACKARKTEIAIAEGMARKVIAAREEAEAAKRAADDEARETARARAEGRETPQDRRQRLAAEALKLIRGTTGAA